MVGQRWVHGEGDGAGDRGVLADAGPGSLAQAFPIQERLEMYAGAWKRSGYRPGKSLPEFQPP